MTFTFLITLPRGVYLSCWIPMTSLTQSRLEMMFNLTSGHSSFNWERNRGRRCSIVFVFPEHLNIVRTRDGHRFFERTNDIFETITIFLWKTVSLTKNERWTNKMDGTWKKLSFFYWTNYLLEHKFLKNYSFFYWMNDFPKNIF